MADMRITNVPQASSVVTTNDFYCKIGTTFRRVPISALMTLIESEIDFTPEPNFNQKFLVMKLENGVYVIDNVNSDFVGTDYQTFAAFAGAVWQAHDNGYEVFCKITDGQYENAVPFNGNLGGAMLKFSGWELSADGLQPVVYTYTETYGFVREVIQMGGGGTADVTPTAVATAIAGMSAQQKTDSRTNLGAEVAGAAATVQGNLDAVTALLPPNASSSNKLATAGDIPVTPTRNSSTDTVKVKQDPTTKELYVPTYPSGGAIDPADIVNATGQMNTTQQTSTRQNIGAEQAGAAAAVQTNLDAVTEKIPSNASSSNKLATQADLPVFSDRNASTDTVEVKKDPTTKKLYVPAGSSGGISKLTVTIQITAGGYVSSHSPSEIAAARSNGDVVEVDCNGVMGWITNADANGADALSISVDGGAKVLEMWYINTSKSVTLGTQDIGDAYKPTTEPLNGATPTIAYAAINTIYKGGTLDSLTVTQFGNNGMFMLIFDSGSTATNLVLPEYDAQHPTNHYVKWGDFTVEANKHYEVSINVIDGVGYLVGKGW